ncbi:alpha-1-antitrypsin-like [Lissotriton helveticus]
MRPAFYMCLMFAVLGGVVNCDHHKDHEQKDHSAVHQEQHQHHHDGHQAEHHAGEHDDHQIKEHMTCHKITDVNAEFAFKFFKHMISKEECKNIFFSPVSISTAFALLSLGAKEDTLHQMIDNLGFNRSEITEEDLHGAFKHLIHTLNDPKSDLQLSTGNALFIEENMKILAKFLEDAKLYYDSEAFPSNFMNSESAKKQINDYVEKQTHGKIVELLQSIDPSTLMILINYIHFKGKWEKPFDPKLTTEADFFINNVTTVRVPMMHSYTSNRSWRDRKLGCTIVELPYAGNASALFILPNEGNMDKVEDALSVATLEMWRRSFRKNIVNLNLPKLSISSTIQLKEHLMKLGITDVFSNNADLSGITGARDLKVSKALHKAVLSIDEKGTEAAGATAVELIPLSFVFPTAFNRPFLLLIYDHVTKSILFMGKICNPALA